MKPYIVMDTETQLLANQVEGGWDNVFGMKMASCVTYSSLTDEYNFWRPEQFKDLVNYLTGQLVVTYNGIFFDSKLLLGDDRIIELNGITKSADGKNWWINADIFVEIWRNILGVDRSNYPAILVEMKKRGFGKGVFSLDDIARATLNREKNGHGDMAPSLFQQGRIAELFCYNLQDVRLTKMIYQFIQLHRYVVTGDYNIVKFL